MRTFPELQKYANYWPVKEIIRNKLYDSKRNLSQKKKKQSAAANRAAARQSPFGLNDALQTPGIDGSTSPDAITAFVKDLHSALPPQEETASLCRPERLCSPVQTSEVRISWFGQLFTGIY